MSKRVGIIVLIMVAGGLIAGVGHAENHASVSSGGDRVDAFLGRHNIHSAFDKGGRGLSNFFFGWLEIPLNIGKRYSASDTVGSGLSGAGIGVFKGIVRTGVGLYEAVTFFLPYPEHFAPILPTLEYFQKTATRRQLPLE